MILILIAIVGFIDAVILPILSKRIYNIVSFLSP